MQRIYLVWVNSDRTEGRGPMRVEYICSNEVAAKELAKGQGVMGYGDGEVTEDFMYDSALELQQKIKDDFIRKEAIKKLTKEEQRVLGIK